MYASYYLYSFIYFMHDYTLFSLFRRIEIYFIPILVYTSMPPLVLIYTQIDV
jgi:hypothetical protein